MSAFRRDLAAVETDAEALAVVWVAVKGDGDPPTPEDLAAWWGAGRQCPEPGFDDSGRALLPVSLSGPWTAEGEWRWTVATFGARGSTGRARTGRTWKGG